MLSPHTPLVLLLSLASGGLAGCGGSTTHNASADTMGAGGTTTDGTTTGGSTTSNRSSSGGITSGGVTSAGTSSVSTTGGAHCEGLDCAAPYCPDGDLVVPPGNCCPLCVCEPASCEPLDCPNGETELKEGHCCPTCAAPACEGVQCAEPTTCPEGYSFDLPPGACCPGCIPDPGAVGCIELPCPPSTCAPGYVPGDLVGGCCHECLPDPLYCATDADCVMADRPRMCCGCPEAASVRLLAHDLCWFDIDNPREIPDECYPDATCDAFCGACAPPGGVQCVSNRCVALQAE